MNYLKNTCFFLLALTAMFFLWIPIGIRAIFGDIELASIIFHIFMPKTNMGLDWLIILSIYLIICIVSIGIIGYLYLHFEKRRLGLIILMFLTLAFDAYYLEVHFSAGNYLISRTKTSPFIEQHYVFPQDTAIQFPQHKRNLIFIQVESLESSMQDKQHGGLFSVNYIPELTALAQNNISFSSSDLIEGAIVLPESGWTMGGLVAETAGIPLKSYKLHHAREQIGNHYHEYKSFLSQVISLGDILKAAGYKNYFFLGSSGNFAGQDIYLKNHGSYEIYDQEQIKEKLNVEKPEQSWWGILDQDLYTFSKQKLTELAHTSQPFSVLIQTIDSHRGGYLSPACPQRYNEQIKNVYACVSAQLNEFITWCSQQDFFKDTTIVVVGDHCNMERTFLWNDINPQTGYYEGKKRKVYNVFINSAIKPYKEKNRLFSTFDIFPTTLAALGVQIQGDRLGLGTNLFSDKQTLLEQYDYEYVSEELRKKSNFYNEKLLFPKHMFKIWK